jgi:hypothetical protein
MQSTILSPASVTASLPAIRRVVLWWMVAGTVLTLGGCVSQQTYESARQEAKTRANQLAQTQAEIESLEQQRDATHAANQRDERALGNLKSELQKIRASLDQMRKDSLVKLAMLRQSIAALSSRHRAMLKEISETKQYEKKLETLTAQHKLATATIPTEPAARVTPIDSLQQEPRMVAVITPQSEESSSTISHPSGASSRNVPASTVVSPSTGGPQEPPSVVATSAPASLPVKTIPAPTVTASPSPTAPPAQGESWFSSMQKWLASMFDWIWS